MLRPRRSSAPQPFGTSGSHPSAFLPSLPFNPSEPQPPVAPTRLSGIYVFPVEDQAFVQIFPSALGGYGLYACRPFAEGDIIIQENPLVAVPCSVELEVQGLEGVEQVESAVRSLGYAELETFWSFGQAPFYGPCPTTAGVFKTNFLDLLVQFPGITTAVGVWDLGLRVQVWWLGIWSTIGAGIKGSELRGWLFGGSPPDPFTSFLSPRWIPTILNN
mmetsp:Transcript_49129/g.76628  ORF Transcript_49129/g.76628 Transcript_49129/m.76628 type:complete len:217 (-) Transcript_49129:432-1082(-)